MKSNPKQISLQFCTQQQILRRIGLEIALLAVLVGPAVKFQSSTNRETWRPGGTAGSGGMELSAGLIGAQIPVDTSTELQYNAEAFNRSRNRSIHDETQKLLKLAIALRSELNRTSGKALNKDAAQKAKEIEKLAHKVKETMRWNPTLGPI